MRNIDILRTPERIKHGFWEKNSIWLNALLFIIGATSTIDIALVGRVTLAEIICFLLVPFLWLSSPQYKWNRNLKYSFLLLATLFFGVIVSDFVNQNYFWFSARAFARPLFMLGYMLFFISVLVRSPLALIYLIYGQVVAAIIKYYVGSEFEDVGAQILESYAGVVFRVVPLLTSIFIALTVFVYPRSRLLAATVLFAGGISMIVVGSARSTVLIWFISCGVILAILALKNSTSRRISLTKPKLMGIYLFLGAMCMSIYIGYVYSAPKGYLGENQRIKFEEQQNTIFGASPLGMILGGRPQVYGAILGISERPIFGFGSWRHDLTSPYVVEAISNVGTDPRLIDRINRYGIVDGAGHSVLFQTWVENGIVPAIVLLLILAVSIKVIIFFVRFENRLTPFIVFTIISFLWSFFFSPPGISLRFNIGLFLAMYVVFMDKQKSLARVEVLPR